MKSRGGAPEDKADSGRWMLTYSDMITLLLALFILMYSMSTADAAKFKDVSNALKVVFHTADAAGSATGQIGSGTGLLLSGMGGVSSGAGFEPGQAADADALGQIYSALKGYVDKNNLSSKVGLSKNSQYVQVSMKDVMFQPNTSDMTSASLPVIREVALAITKVYPDVDHVTISGHTADVQVANTASDSDQISWKLSTERALTVLDKLQDNGLPGKKLSVQGYAQYSPVAPNDTETGRAKNRRVEITIYKNPTQDAASQAAAKTAKAVAASAGTSTASNASTTSSKK